MPLKLINLGPKWTRITLVLAGILCVLLTWYFIRWNIGNVIASQIDSKRPEAPLLADWLTRFAPADPQTHSLAGRVFERTFDPADLERAVREFETAASLSPNNYLMWMNLGKALSLRGETEGALAAYRRALDLAPNYADIQWTYGNALVRDGETDQGFALIAKAARADPGYLQPGIATALQLLEGDVEAVRTVMGNDGRINAGLATALVSAKRFEDAADAWGRIPAESKPTEFKQLGESLVTQLIEARSFRLAARIQADVEGTEEPAVGMVTNGGFERPVKPRNAGIFEWGISEGTHPQVGISDALKRTGQYGLLLLFSSVENAGLRSIDQTIATEPGVELELEIFYRSDIRSNGVLRWEILDPANSARIAVSEPLVPASEWTPVQIRFRSAESTDAIRIRLIREGCSGPMCQMNGRLSLDDITLRRP